MLTVPYYARWRYGVVALLMLTSAGLISRNLVVVQITQHTQMLAAARAQYQSVVLVPPQRGMIYDRNGNVLVQNLPLTKVAIFPDSIPPDDPAVGQVAHLLSLSQAALWTQIHTALTKGGGYAHYLRVASSVSLDIANSLRALHLPWLSLEQHNTLAYPSGTEAAQVLGFMNTQGQGQYGVEQSYATALQGSMVTTTVGTVATPHNGANLYLTIDAVVQHVVEDVLSRTVAAAQADGGEAIVMDPNTGAVLAMAAVPTYDPSNYAQYAASNPGVFVNPNTSIPYEPGSTFKILTIAAALDSHRVMSTTTVYDGGSLSRYGQSITNWTNGTGWGYETPLIMLRYSANVGAAQFAELTGADQFYHYMQAFGLGQATGIDLPNDNPGVVHWPTDPTGWSPLSLDTNAFGQGLSVTPLQLITAASAVANGGLLLRPYVVQQIHDGQTVINTRPQVVRRVISQSTATTLTNILEASAVEGEASLALVPGYGIAAKTGTAQVAGPGCGYSCNLGTIASLMGWAPAHHPRFICLVVVNHPRTSPWGSVVAAPAFHDIAARLFNLLGIAPNTPEGQ